MKNDKPIHEFCVDKTSCRHETTLDEAAGYERKERAQNQPESQAGFTPTGHMTKDHIRKAYEEKMGRS